MRYLIFLFFLLLATVHSKGPEKVPALTSPEPVPYGTFTEDSALAAALFYLADSALFNLQYDSAIFYFAKSVECYERLVHSTHDSLIWAGFANALFSIGYSHQMNRDMKTGLQYLQRSLKVVLERFGEDHPTAAWIYFKMARSYIAMGDNRAERSCTLKGFNICQKISGKNEFLLGQAYHEMGYQYFLLNDRKKIEIYFNKTEQIYDHIESHHRENAPASESIFTRNKSYKSYKINLHQPNSVLADFPLNYAEFHLRKSSHNLTPERLKIAKYSLNKAFDCYLLNSYLKPRLHFRLNFIKAYILMGENKIQEALNIADHLIAYTKKDNNKYIFIDAYETKAHAFEKTGEYESAFQCMNSCFRLYKPEGDLGITSYIYRRMAELAVNTKRYQMSLHYTDSLIGMILRTDSRNKLDHLNWQDYSLHEIRSLIPALKYRYLALSELNKNHENIEYLKALHQLSEKIHEATIFLHSLVYTDANRLTLEADNYRFYEKAILINQKLFKLTRDPEHSLQALTWSETGKNVLWSKRIMEQNIGSRYSYKNTMEKINAVSHKIKEAEYGITALDVNPGDADLKRKIELESRLADFYVELELLKDQYSHELLPFATELIKNRYPLKAIQNKLKTQQSVLLDYFYGDSMLVINLVSPDTAITRLVSKGSEFSNHIFNYLTAVRSPGQASPDSLIRLSEYLKERLIMPVSNYITTQNIVIIPDGILHLLPFELFFENPNAPHAIRFEYSSGSLLQKSKGHKSPQYVGFAPKYTGTESIEYSRQDSILLTEMYEANRSSLGPLRFNIPEVTEAARLLNGNSFTGKKVNKHIFIKNSKHAGILHLALHALDDSENPEYSQFLLNSGTNPNANDPLYSFQIKNLSLQADLAILSACNTGAGKYQIGNGVQSLAKSFKEAGCNNIVMSLWPVNDASTKEIVVGFIKNLKKGLGKADALARSKKDYLAMAPEEMKHPYYWAGLVLIGDNEPMFGMGSEWLNWSGLIGTMLGLITLMSIWLFQHKKTLRSASTERH